MKMQEETGPIWPQAKEHQGMLVAYRIERHTVDSPLECLGSTFVLDFRTPELWENKILLFRAAKFLVICYSNPRKLIYPLMG